MSEENEMKTSSFAVVIEPEFENGQWTGTVGAHIEEDVLDDLDVDELTQIRSVVGMMASTLTLMEHDPEFLDYVRDHFIDNYQEIVEQFLNDIEDNSPNFTRSEDGKVIQLNFNTKTHGSA